MVHNAPLFFPNLRIVLLPYVSSQNEKNVKCHYTCLPMIYHLSKSIRKPTWYLLSKKRVACPAGSTTSGNLWLNLSSTTAFSRHRSSAGNPIPCTPHRTPAGGRNTHKHTPTHTGREREGQGGNRTNLVSRSSRKRQSSPSRETNSVDTHPLPPCYLAIILSCSVSCYHTIL